MVDAMEREVTFAETPRALWIELTSVCPYDCVFCSRKLRRGKGVHLPFDAYRRLVQSLVAPRRLVLNYSGESTFYPELVPAIELGASTGALVELVSAFSVVGPERLRPLAESGLGRLTVSVHAADPATYQSIYRHSSFDDLRERLSTFLEICAGLARPPVVDLAFVAMEQNLERLGDVVAFGESLGLHHVLVFPIKRRDELPFRFENELEEGGRHRASFRRLVSDAMERVSQEHPGVTLTVCDPTFSHPLPEIGRVPVTYPASLPSGARIHTCEQNPMETAHVLSNGDVVACEVLDAVPLGNLLENTMAEIWEGEAYRRFRRQYRDGDHAACRDCVWKKAYVPSVPARTIRSADGPSPQLLYGWHDQGAETVVWSTQRATAEIARDAGSEHVVVRGILPPGPSGRSNALSVMLDGRTLGTQRNATDDSVSVDLHLELPERDGDVLTFEFRTEHVYRPREHGKGQDQRDLGFALVELST